MVHASHDASLCATQTRRPGVGRVVMMADEKKGLLGGLGGLGGMGDIMGAMKKVSFCCLCVAAETETLRSLLTGVCLPCHTHRRRVR